MAFSMIGRVQLTIRYTISWAISREDILVHRHTHVIFKLLNRHYRVLPPMKSSHLFFLFFRCEDKSLDLYTIWTVL